jgi:hypothetical protein
MKIYDENSVDRVAKVMIKEFEVQNQLETAPNFALFFRRGAMRLFMLLGLAVNIGQ